MRLSVCLGAMRIPEYIPEYILIPEYPKRTRPECFVIYLDFPLNNHIAKFDVRATTILQSKFLKLLQL